MPLEPPKGPKPPAGPGRPEPTKTPEVPRVGLHPKIKAQAGLAGLLGVLVIVAGTVPQIADKLGIGLPAIVTTVVSMILLIGRGFQKAGDGR